MDLNQIVETLSKLSVMEAAELSKMLEEKWGVSAAAPVAAAGAAAGPAAEAQTEFSVHLVASGDKKIDVIKAIREITGLGLKEAKDMAEGAPVLVKDSVPAKDAEDMKKKLEAAGAKVELK